MEQLDVALITKVVKATLEEMGEHRCPLMDIGMTNEDHKEHHKIIRRSLEDWSAIRRAFFIGVVTTLSGGILGLLWFAIKFYPKS